MDMYSIESRLAALEKSNRRLRFSLFAVFALAAAGLVAGAAMQADQGRGTPTATAAPDGGWVLAIDEMGTGCIVKQDGSTKLVQTKSEGWFHTPNFHNALQGGVTGVDEARGERFDGVMVQWTYWKKHRDRTSLSADEQSKLDWILRECVTTSK